MSRCRTWQWPWGLGSLVAGISEGGRDGGMEEPGVADLSGTQACRRRPDREELSRRHQHEAGASRAGGVVRRDSRQGHGEPDVAQSEERLGCLEHPLAGRGADRAPDPRWYVVRVRLDRKATSISLLVILGVRRTARRYCSRSRACMGRAPRLGALSSTIIKRRLRRPEFLIVDGAPGLDKAIAAVWDGVPVQRWTVHKHRNLFARAPAG
jgi:hypothetical protein